MILFLAWATAAAGAAPAAAAASQGTSDFDVQCMIVIEQVTSSDRADAATKSQLAMALMYYFGRVDSVASGNALKARIRAATKGLQGHQIAPVLKGCGEYMTKRGTAMETLGKSLQAEDKK